MRVDKETSRNVRWIALVMAPCGLLIRNTNFPAGMLAAKLRQLPLVGYTPIMVSFMEDSNERINLVKNNAKV